MRTDLVRLTGTVGGTIFEYLPSSCTPPPAKVQSEARNNTLSAARIGASSSTPDRPRPPPDRGRRQGGTQGAAPSPGWRAPQGDGGGLERWIAAARARAGYTALRTALRPVSPRVRGTRVRQGGGGSLC
jgi:hypothetical protein